MASPPPVAADLWLTASLRSAAVAVGRRWVVPGFDEAGVGSGWVRRVLLVGVADDSLSLLKSVGLIDIVRG